MVYDLQNLGTDQVAMSADRTMIRNDLLRQCEDEARRIMDSLPLHVRAICYRYLHTSGMRIDATEKLIRDGIDTLVRQVG